MEGKYIVFHVGKERMGVPIQSVERILLSSPVTRIPRSPEMVLGMFSHAGVTIPVIDSALRFDIPAPERYEHFLILATEFGRYALLVEGVDQIVDFVDKDFDVAQSWLSSIEPDLAYGVGKQKDGLCLLIRPEAVVPKGLQQKMSKIVA